MGSDELTTLAAALDEASQVIADQQRRLRLALEVGRVNIWEVDAAGRMTMQGDRAGEYGSTMEAGLSTLRPNHAQLVRDAVAAVRLDGEPRDYEVQNATDGRWFAGRLMRASETDVLGVSVDVTSLRRAQDERRSIEVQRGHAALAVSERRGRYNSLVLGSAGEGIAVVDQNGVCMSANPAAARLLGYDVDDLVGKDLHTLCHHSHADGSAYPSAQCPLLLAAATGHARRVDDEVFWRRDGTPIPVSYSVAPLTDDGLLRGGVLTFTDVVARLVVDEETERATASLRSAIRNDELVLHYQPKVDLRDGSCRRVEALVRWASPERGLLFPDAFIPLAESSGLIHELTGWVVREAVRQARTWQDQGRYLSVAVNIAASSLSDLAALELIRTSLEEFEVSPFSLEIELTESGVMGDPAAARALLDQLDRMGIKVSIDDFGTGFSSLVYLRDLPVHTLKIDKSFVMDMLANDRNRAIVASTIALGHALGLRVVAEGVEDAETAEALLVLGCDEGQGYVWTKALPAVALENWLADFSGQPVRQSALGPVTNDGHALRAVRRVLASTDAGDLTGALVDYVHAVGGTVADPGDDVEGMMQLDLTLGLAAAVSPVASPGTLARQHLEETLPLLLTAAQLVVSRGVRD